jgi:hypothetical protein
MSFENKNILFHDMLRFVPTHVTVFNGFVSVELVVFPKTFAITKELWTLDRPVLVKGRVSEKDDRLAFIVDDAKILEL